MVAQSRLVSGPSSRVPRSPSRRAATLASVGAQTLDADAMKRAADLGSLARQHELAAWELAAREAKVRAASADPMAATHALLARYADPPTTST
jgi:hypothetical protein